MTTIIFPTAKVVTKDLQGVGRLPAIIYPIDQMRMIDLFYEYYFIEMRIDGFFEIVAHEEFEQVMRRIGKRERVSIHKVDEIKDIGYTILWGMKQIAFSDSDKVIINFSDVAELGHFEERIEDRCYYTKEDISSRWTFFKHKNGTIAEYFDKPKSAVGIGTNDMLIGLFHIEKPKIFRDLLEIAQSKKNGLDSFWVALKEYSQIRPFNMICTDEWFDIGHIDKYYDMQMAIKSRTFNHITIDRSRGILKKTSDEKEKFIGEIKWYLKLPNDVEYARPRIFSYSTSYAEPYVSMEYYAYHTLHEVFLFGDLSDEQWKNIFRRVRFILNDFKRYTVKDSGIKESLKEMYVDKTIDRLMQMEGVDGFPNYNEILCVNGVNYQPLKLLCKILKEVIEQRLMKVEEFSIIHGDLCFSNIMIDPNYSFIKLIDPRGRFGRYDIYGDRRYELAKLMHSIDGKYDYIIKEKFSDEEGYGNTISYKIDYDQSADIEDCFYHVFEEEFVKEGNDIRLIEALLFFSMLPLHSESLRQQRVMLGTAISIMDNVCNIRV